jgi:glycosyltransferase involved in cell wall biosynthesis
VSKPALLVDAHSPGSSGVGRYTRELVRGLAAREDFRMIYLAGNPAEVSQWLTNARGAAVGSALDRSDLTPVTIIPFRHARHSPHVPLAWATFEAQVQGPRVSWFPYWDGAWTASPGVATIHDLIFLDAPGLRALPKRVITRAWMQRMVAGSRAIVTVSEYSAQRLRAEFPLVGEKLHVIPNGVSPNFFRTTPSTSRTAPYLLTVGNKRPHKRFETAIRAFARIAAERPELELRMVGNRDSHATVLRALAAELGVAERVHDIPPMGDAELAQVYADAEALMVTSRDEGFGLIALEAMAAGTPVVAVDRGPMREVLSDAGVLVPFDDDAALAKALRTLDREACIVRGRARAASFTWERAAATLARVLVASAS